MTLRKAILIILVSTASLLAQTESEPNSVWLYTQPNFAGEARQIRRNGGDLGSKVTYRSVRVGARAYVELFSGKRHSGTRTVAYAAIEDLAGLDPPISPPPLEFGRKAGIVLNP